MDALNITHISEEDVENKYTEVMKSIIVVNNKMLYHSKKRKCFLSDMKRPSIKGIRIYPYQLVAYKKYGIEEIKKISSSKKGSSNSNLTISHLCNRNNCINPLHIEISTKQINDERTHCHAVLDRYRHSIGIKEFRVNQKRKAYKCGHNPTCGFVEKNPN